MLLLFSNGMVQIMLAFMYLFKKKPKKTGLDWPHHHPWPLAFITWHLMILLISAGKHESRGSKKMARDEKNMEVLLNTNSVLEKQSSWIYSIFKECIRFKNLKGFGVFVLEKKSTCFTTKPFSHFCNGKCHPQTPKASDTTTVHAIRFRESERVWSGNGTISLTEIIMFLSR